jgi:RNA polymerase sigma-70 factor (ECF subfamily)
MTSAVGSHAGLSQPLLQRACQGDAAALDELLRHSAQRLMDLARHMLRGFPGVRRWADTDDVLQNALLRLVAALREVRPDTPRDFLGLATLQIRRELIDLARHYYGPQGPGANHASRGPEEDGKTVHYDKADSTFEPSSLAEWCDFHAKIDRLPDDEREVVGLLFYQGLTQADAAELLGVTVRTVQRRWHSALLKLHDALHGQWPGS